jgi:hypothetical protein
MANLLARPSPALRSHPLVASALAPGENRNAFEQFVTSWVEDLRPEGAVETTLAIRAATLAWRLNRAQKLETQVLARRGSSGTNLIESSMADRYARGAVEMVSRWEQAIERSLFRILAQFEAMQERRRKSNGRVITGKPEATEAAIDEVVPQKPRVTISLDPEDGRQE